MAYIEKGTSEVVDNSNKKLNVMKKIDEKKKETINYGDTADSLTVTELAAKLDEYDAAIKDYDTAMDAVTAAQNRVDAIKAQLKDLNKRILKSAAGRFTGDSDEYEMLGGTRESEWILTGI